MPRSVAPPWLSSRSGTWNSNSASGQPPPAPSTVSRFRSRLARRSPRGESGSGKSVTALSIARLLPYPPARYVGGQILVDDRDVLKMSPWELCAIRGGVVRYVFQEPGASLNPVFRVGVQVKEALEYHRPDVATDKEVTRLLKFVGIPAAEFRKAGEIAIFDKAFRTWFYPVALEV